MKSVTGNILLFLAIFILFVMAIFVANYLKVDIFNALPHHVSDGYALFLDRILLSIKGYVLLVSAISMFFAVTWLVISFNRREYSSSFFQLFYGFYIVWFAYENFSRGSQPPGLFGMHADFSNYKYVPVATIYIMLLLIEIYISSILISGARGILDRKMEDMK